MAGNVQAMQQFLSDSTWEAGLLIGELQAMAQEALGERLGATRPAG